MNKSLSNKFANMGFVCVCLVVSMHLHCPWECGGINKLAVPFFFLMSGYFLAAHVNEEGWYGRALSKRLRTLVVPLFAWCAIWLMFSVPLAIVLNIHAGRNLLANVLTGWGVLRYFALDITRTPALGPLWYIRCLFFFVIVSPVIVYVIRRMGLVVLLILGSTYYIVWQWWPDISFLRFGFSLEGVFYFSLGLFLRMKQMPLNFGPMVGFFAFSVGILAYYIGWTEASIAVMIVGLWGVIPERRFPAIFTNNTFPIYLIHMFVIAFFGSSRIISISLSLGLSLATVAMSIIIAEGIRRFVPRFACVLWGGR